LERKQFIGVGILMRLWVSLFKTAKPSSLGLDHSGKVSENRVIGKERIARLTVSTEAL